MKIKLLVAWLGCAAVTALLIRSADVAAPREIRIKSGIGNVVKFDVDRITAAPGEPLKVILTNASTLPKAVMGHDWILLAKGTDPLAFANAAVPEAANGYVPTSMKDKILASIALLGPGQTGEVTFQAPSAPGDYPFVCTFPGHCQLGMKGTLVVK